MLKNSDILCIVNIGVPILIILFYGLVLIKLSKKESEKSVQSLVYSNTLPQCVLTCGNAVRSRTVKCVSSESPNVILDESMCIENKPAETENCNLPAC